MVAICFKTVDHIDYCYNNMLVERYLRLLSSICCNRMDVSNDDPNAAQAQHHGPLTET